MSDDKKFWGKSWCPKEIAENASNWSLAADMRLLKYLEGFSEDILNQATIVDNNVNSLLNNLSKASLSLDIARNKFLSLSNTQFIESRVYEDDETLLSNEEKNKKEEPNKNTTEESNKNEMRLAALRGVEVINKYFEKVAVVDSDSEEDSDLTSFVLRPRDPYIDRPLPYVIGTDEWYKKLHVGLGDSSSESEDDKLSEKFSDTDSESDLPITNRSQAKSISESGSSEADLSNKLDQPVANSTLNDTNKVEGYLGSSEDYNSVSMPAPISQNAFAEQLAAKLGAMANNRIEEPPVNTRPIQKSSNHDRYSNMFSDEPPPLNDFDEFSPKSKDQGIFSGGDGLFDDLNDDEPFWGSGFSEKQDKVSNPQKPVPNLFGSDDNDFLVTKPKAIPKTIDDNFKKQLPGKIDKMIERNPFDDAESDEDSLFKKPSVIKKPISNKPNKQNSLFDDDEDDDANILQTKERFSNRNSESGDGNRDWNGLFDTDHLLNSELPKKKAPVGGIQVIKNPNIFSEIKKFHQTKHESSSGSPTNEVPTQKLDTAHDSSNESKQLKSETETNKSKIQNKNKVNRLFDDDNEEDDLFNDDLFSSFSSKKTSGGLFDDIGSERHLENVRTIGASTKKAGEPLKDVEEDPAISANGLVKETEHSISNTPKKFENQLFEAPPKIQEVSTGKTNKNIFSPDEDSDSDDLFASKNSKIISKNKIIEKVSSISEPDKTDTSSVALTKEVKRKKIPSLFDDDDNEDDDLFSSNFLQVKKPAPISKKAESNLDSSKKNKLFDEDEEDDLFSTKSSSNDNHLDIFTNDQAFNVKLGEPLENKFGNLTKSRATEAKTLKQKDILGSSSVEGISEHMENVFQGDDPNNKLKEVGDSFNFKPNEGHLFKANIQKQHAEDKTSNDIVNDSNVEKPLFLEIREDEDMTQSNDSAKSVPKNDSPSEITCNFGDKSPPEEENLSNTLNESRLKQSETDEKAPIEDVSASPEDISISDELLPQLHPKNILQELNQENEEYSFLSSTASSKNAHDSPADRVPPVNIFDPNPPPDIEDWDDRPEPNIFYDDIYTFDNTENFSENRSSIFDREPPSVFNETSGIVKDQSARLDTDTSSFYPYATSSRRFSNDLFNEEQSNDSLFTAKNNVNSFGPNIPPSITEDTEESLSNVDITPSGKLEDLYSEASISRNPKSVTFEDNISAKNELNEREAREIGTSKTTALSTTENLSNHGTEDVKIGKPKPALLKKPNLKKVSSFQEKVHEAGVHDNTSEETISKDVSTTNKQKPEENKGQPQKLKHKLDINVFALLPGAGKPTKKENPTEPNVSQPRQRSASLDSEERENNIVFRVTSPNETTPTSPTIENSIGDVEVLESVTKTRARGPVKRRPSTKRGRDAIRNSCIELSFETSPSIEDYHNKVNKGISNENHQTFKNDLEPKFDQHPKSVIASTNSTKLETNKSWENAENTSNKESAALIENENNSTSKLENHGTSKEPPRKNLFSDDTDSDDMFSNPNAKKSDNTASNIPPKKSGHFDVTRHLPFDEDKDQDLFGQNQTVPPLEVAEDSLLEKDHSESLLGSKDELQDSSKKTANEITAGILIQDEVQVNSGKKTDPISDSSIGGKIKAGTARKAQISSTRDLFDDDTDDDDLFSSARNRKSENYSSNSKIADSKTSSISGANHPSKSVTSVDFGLSDDEDIFSAKKTASKKPDTIKRLPFDDDDDDDDLFGSTSKGKQQEVTTASIPSRRLKTSNLKKLENTILTGDDPLNALNN